MVDMNVLPWLVPLWPLLAFATISLGTLLLWLFGARTNTIPATDERYGGHHPDYNGMDVPYQPDWFRVFAIVVGISGIVASLISAWTLVFSALSTYGPGSFGKADKVYSSSIQWMATGGFSLDVGVLVDPLNATLLFMVPLAMLCIFVYSIGYMANDPRQAKFFALISLFAAAMFMLTVADNLLVLFVGWEIMGFCSYSLIGFWYEKKSAYKAAIKAFTVTRVADVVMLLGIVYLYYATTQVVDPTTGELLFPFGTLNFRDILYNVDVFQQIGQMPGILLGGFGVSAAGVIGMFLIVGTIGKSAQFPLHVWLPDAMEGPTPVSAMIHAAAMVSAGVYAIIRMYPMFIGFLGDPHHGTFTSPLLLMALVGSFTALFAATMGVAQRDVKAVLAYSTISQLGFMVAALGIGAYIAATFHLITHAFFKALLFMASGSVIHAMEHGEHHVHEHHAHDDHGHGHDDHAHVDASEEHAPHGHHDDDDHGHHFDPQDMFNMGGLAKNIPVTFYTFMIGGLSLAGFPLITAGFWSKDEILADAWLGTIEGFGPQALVFIMLALAAFLTAFYTMRQLGLTFWGDFRTEEAEHANLGGPTNVVSITMQAPLIVLAIFALLAGFYGVPGDFPIFGAIFSPEGNNFKNLVLYSLPEFAGPAGEVFRVSAPPFNLIPVLTSFAVALGGLYVGWLMYWKNPLKAGEEDPLINIIGEPVYKALQNRYYMDDLYDIVVVRPSQWVSRQIIVFVDKGFIDGILHFIAAFFTWLGDFIKVMNAWLIDGVGDGIPKGIYAMGGWLRGTQSGRIQLYLLIVLVSVLVIGVLIALSSGTVTATL